jgi:very-short-patch-repair endonuclease
MRPRHLQDLIDRELKKQYPDEMTPHHKAYRRAQPVSQAEETLDWQIRHLTKLPKPEREVKLVEGREWRCDFVWFPQKLVVEIEGGLWNGGRHVQPKGYQEDMKKYNAIESLGYRIHRFSPEQVKYGEVLDFLEDFFANWKPA